MKKDWLQQKEDFFVFDVRALQGNFLPAVEKKARDIPRGGGMRIVQNFEPIPLYSTMENLGYEHHTEKRGDGVFEVYFFRREAVEREEGELPLKPIVMPRYAEIDKELADLVVHFWDRIWNRADAAIDLKTKLLLSLANAVGSGRVRQATRELVKAYSLGVTVEQFAELFALIIWNQGVGHFSSEIAQSPLFKAYMLIKSLEKQGMDRKAIMDEVTESFGEQHPESGFGRVKRKCNKMRREP
ncbi:MAG: DUF2249 domain-containing protein [Acidobacteriota bacterium]|jgi:alkylhydroperoxidase/carboxymuconolactone decarboxylase family protein YurZ|nr:DUF2249 domain-containing protein [Acidobacteriota bacterium]